LQGYLWANQVLLKDFGTHAQQASEIVKGASLETITSAGRPVRYLYSSREDKEEIAREIAAQDRIEEGAVAALTCVEPCWGYDIHRNRETKRLDLVQRSRKCLIVYQYWQDPELGWMNARIQTWFPFSIQICINGREWLARQMKKEGIGYQKQDNCFVWVEDWERAQQLLNEQLRTDWAGLLNRIAHGLNPRHEEMFAQLPVDYYWSIYQSEWASDVTFHNSSDLRRLFPIWLRHAMITFQSADILKFLGKRVTAEGEVPGSRTSGSDHVTKASATGSADQALVWEELDEGLRQSLHSGGQHVTRGDDDAGSGKLQSLPASGGATGKSVAMVSPAPRHSRPAKKSRNLPERE